LLQIDDPIVLESHAGYGKLYQQCYRGIATGVAFEKDQRKAAAVAQQRPTWAVYQADCIRALQAGVGSHLRVNVLDVDPYGEPWPALRAFFSSKRPFSQTMVVVVNDGLRQKIKMTGGWNVGSLGGVIRRYGNHCYESYKEICQELLGEIVFLAGYRIEKWTAYYCGALQAMTHYAARLNQETRT
jgi:hypothetical protein